MGSFFITRVSAGNRLAWAAPVTASPRVDEADETAVALGYRRDTTKVDRQRHPLHHPVQRCTTCSLFHGGAADAWGGCAMFGRKLVAAGGWCAAWAKQPD